MNREIIFKAKRKDWRDLPKEQWWIEGLPTRMWRELYIQDSEDENTAYKIDPDTLCQYTGFTDKNGRKIWESDIVKHEDSQCSGAIRWYRGDYVGWCVDDVHDYEQQFSIDMFNECEVIGNIFDNVDLLEVE